MTTKCDIQPLLATLVTANLTLQNVINEENAEETCRSIRAAVAAIEEEVVWNKSVDQRQVEAIRQQVDLTIRLLEQKPDAFPSYILSKLRDRRICLDDLDYETVVARLEKVYNS